MKRPLIISLCFVLPAACNVFSVPATQMSSTPIENSLQATSTVGPIEIENARLDYYSIFGSSESELRAQLDAKAPIGYDGYKGDATTNWYIRWDWPGYGNSSCDLSKATVSIEIVVTFPRWAPPNNAPRDLVAKWDRFTRDLADHEQNHVDFVVDNYLTVLDAIRNATCQTADAAATSALEPIRQLDRDYDAATNHGETEGVRFP
jgi:predicted secreted Zn-dependent protease